MSHCTCDYHQGQNKKRQLGDECCVCFGEKVFDDGIVHCDCKCHKSSEEKKDWEEEFDLRFYYLWQHIDREGLVSQATQHEAVKQFICEKLKEEREKWRLKNAGLYRQLFGEMNDSKTFTAKELWKIFDDYAPLFTEEQKKELKDNLNSIMK